MAGRIRSIKPEILDDERSAGLSHEAWRLWVSMWLVADDFGRLRGDSRRLAATIFWARETAAGVDSLIGELVSKQLIRCYEVRGQKYVEISNWSKHQRIDNASKRGVLPGPEEASPRPAETRGEPPRLAETRRSDLDLDLEGKGEEGKPPPASDSSKVIDEWRAATGILVSGFMGDLVNAILDAARAHTPPREPAEYARECFLAFVKWVDSCPPDRKPQRSPNKFLEHFPRIQELVSGNRKPPTKQAAGLTLTQRIVAREEAEARSRNAAAILPNARLEQQGGVSDQTGGGK